MTMAFGICGATFPDMAALKSAGFIDMHQVIGGGGQHPDTSFVTQCQSLGVSPILNNGNDGVAGWDGSDSYYATLASDGYQAAGGESEHDAEDQSIMSHMIFMNYGGQGTGGVSGNNDIFGGGECSHVSGKGCASYLESYTSGSMISASDMAAAAAANKKAGCKEVGIMIGNWALADYGADVSTYSAMVDAFTAAGVTCAGFVLWLGEGSDANQTYNNNQSLMNGLISKYGHSTQTIGQRFTGVTPVGPVTPVTPTINGTIFGGMSEIDITEWLTKSHNGQPTPGEHTVTVYPIGGSSTSTSSSAVDMTARPRTWQPGRK